MKSLESYFKLAMLRPKFHPELTKTLRNCYFAQE